MTDKLVDVKFLSFLTRLLAGRTYIISLCITTLAINLKDDLI